MIMHAYRFIILPLAAPIACALTVAVVAWALPYFMGA